jgi:methionine aminotransferase
VKPLASKLPNAGTTIFTVMTRLAEEHGAINLGQGFPEFQPPARLRELVDHYIRAGRNQYAPMSGAQSLRRAIAAKTHAVYGAPVDPETEITVTSGATEAIFCAIQAVVQRGDDVIVLDPCYDSYEPSITLAGGRTVHVPLREPHFGIDWQRLSDSLGARTRLVIINSPHNPTGALVSSADLARLAELLRSSECLVLSDEVYEHIVFDGATHASVLTNAELAERSFVISSFGKTYHATGWKVGYCIAPRTLTDEFRRVHQYVTFATTTPMQHALADYLLEAPQHYVGLPEFYREKRDYFRGLLQESRFELLPVRGTYFQLASYEAISDRSDVEFARWLTVEHGVATIPVSVFCETAPRERLIRFCFARELQTLAGAAAKLRAL